MSPLQVVVAVFCLVGSLFLILYVLVLLFVQALRRQVEQLDTRVVDVEHILEIEDYGPDTSLEGDR